MTDTTILSSISPSQYYCVHSAESSDESRSVEWSLAFFEQLLATLQELNRFNLVIALSGGMDSVVLLQLCNEFQRYCSTKHRIISVRAVHINHQLQLPSHGWQNFCQDLCANQQIPFKAFSIKVQETSRQGVESMARNLRYQTLFDCLLEGEALLTAHHQNDQAETFLLNALRQSGVTGLAAMPKVKQVRHHYLVRPLLPYSRKELLQYAAEKKLHWIEDPSNQQNYYRRNWLRNEVIPQLANKFPTVSRNLANTAQNLQEADLLLKKLAEIQINSKLATELYLGRHDELDWLEHKNILQYWLKNTAAHAIVFSHSHYQWIYEHWFQSRASENSNSSYRLTKNKQLRVYQNRLYLLDLNLQSTSIGKFPLTRPPFSNIQRQWGFVLPGTVDVFQEGDWQILELQNFEHAIWYQHYKKRLKSYFQEQGIPVWERKLWPVLCPAVKNMNELNFEQLSILGFSQKALLKKQIPVQQIFGISQLQLWFWMGLIKS